MIYVQSAVRNRLCSVCWSPQNLKSSLSTL